MSDTHQSPAELKWHERLLLAVLALLMRLWGRTLRFHWGADVQAFIDADPEPSVVIFWHNRLFAAPLFYVRYFRQRRLATLISASKDGAWPAVFVKQLGMHPVRGSRYKRGPQAVRDLIAAQRNGHDVALTPDGSRGPLYDMKSGAVTIALKTGAPIVLLSFNYSGAWRLKSWDRFYVPYPFSRIEVRMDDVGPCSSLSEDPKEASALLKPRMDAITRD
ncbi:lysophospholipid acyltransferase family protein [Coraliomargarita sp. SDUM461004]|uniref:Lysophospholipid acyltransferase family protein n=1 Tax=Thalassobacterium sedimentorum TaxID=3041258 RepID=A0ABU1AGS7_9BACT|nr:lysophospholipid acyltransferase family protein [Coraliomargarita sp. SDUM461004]MDQ8193995.1 lysophospholipid acyltransferase family protein [Coraliomargarita sp. SDUM461004]